MVCTRDAEAAQAMKALRGWGRRSEAGASEAPEDRFNAKIDGVEYDAKFVFDAMGYNFLPLELSAAFGEVQLGRLAAFERARTRAFKRLQKFFSDYDDLFVLPKQLPRVKTSWLAYPLTIREPAVFTRRELATFLEKAGIQTRTLFSGNLTRHPGFKGVEAKHAAGGYPVADYVMKHAFVIGCHHGLKSKHLRHIEDTFRAFLDRYV
jgi:CDP-6-deoxy-D-xylo-4-hexulose-3-dehydrase